MEHFWASTPEEREEDNDSYPRGNPNGNRDDKEKYNRRKRHLERIKKEKGVLEELKKRKKELIGEIEDRLDGIYRVS